jgi:gluconate 2-dehydrogenase gamma chain
MDEHNEARRSFLIKSALSVGVVASGALPLENAKAAEGTLTTVTTSNCPASTANNGAGKWRVFFSEDEAYTVTAIAERIMPGAPGMPGATDADVVNYIDLALSGAYADNQDFYRRGLAALDAYCQTTYKAAFSILKPAQQDASLTALEAGKATGFSWPTAQAFFATLRTHTMEGMFADPVYGGNRDFAGWKLVGFPGAQRIYTTADREMRDEFRGPIIGMQVMIDASERK